MFWEISIENNLHPCHFAVKSSLAFWMDVCTIIATARDCGMPFLNACCHASTAPFPISYAWCINIFCFSPIHGNYVLQLGTVKPAPVTTCIQRPPLFRDHSNYGFTMHFRDHLYSKTTRSCPNCGFTMLYSKTTFLGPKRGHLIQVSLVFRLNCKNNNFPEVDFGGF